MVILCVCFVAVVETSIEEVHHSDFGAMKDEETPSSAYYTAVGSGLSGLKLMGLMASAKAPFPEHASTEDSLEKSAITTANQRLRPPRATHRTIPNNLLTKQLPISPLAIERG